MDIPELTRVPVDPEQSAQYARRSLEGPCFVCAILAGYPGYPHHDVYEDYALMSENGVLNVGEDTQASLARAIRNQL